MIETRIPLARPQLGPEEEASVLEVMRSGALAQGECVTRFEEEFASATGARYAIATSSGTAALHLALLAHGIGPGDEVVTSPLTFIASANAIVQAGARPVFADVDDSLNLAPSAAEPLIGPRTKAIMPVHLHGNVFDADAFVELAEEHRVALLQDACQAVGATIAGRPLGGFGTAAYSLYATKNITTGEGGMITTNEAAVARACASLRGHAYVSPGAYLHEAIGYNYRMTEMQAAIGRCQLRKLEAVTADRRSNAAYFDAAIDQQRFPRPRRTDASGHVFHQYVLRVPAFGGLDRDQVRGALDRAGIASGVHYQVPLHMQPPYGAEAHAACPEAERAAADMLSIPVHPGLSGTDRVRIVEAFRALA